MWQAVVINLIALSTTSTPADLPFGLPHINRDEPAPVPIYLKALGLRHSLDGLYSGYWSLNSLADNWIITCRTTGDIELSVSLVPSDRPAYRGPGFGAFNIIPTGWTSEIYLGYRWAVWHSSTLSVPRLGFVLRWTSEPGVSFTVGFDAPLGRPYVEWEISEY
jgi:hypothetical protein